MTSSYSFSHLWYYTTDPCSKVGICLSLIVSIFLATSAISRKAARADDGTAADVGTEPNAVKQVAAGITYQQVEIDPRAVAHVVRIDTKSGAWTIRPYMAQKTETTSISAAKLDAVVAVNCGFFNLSDGESASYIFIDGKQICEPKHNMALVNNEGLKPFLTKIFNRSELRFLEDNSGRTKITIQPHEDAIPRNTRLIHSIQAGPQLLPRFTGREEAFIRRPPGASKDVDSIGCSMRAARTAFGITQDGSVTIVCVQGNRNKEFAEGISLSALAEFMKRIGCVEAINFDGGTSTTMVLSNARSLRTGSPCEETSVGKLSTVVSSKPERQVKSIIYVTPKR